MPERRTLAELGLVSRRTALKVGLGTALMAPLAGSLRTEAAAAAPGTADASVRPAAISGMKIKNLTGTAETGRFAAPWTDLGIPAICPNGTMLFVCGDTFDGATEGASDWRAPVGLRSSTTDLNSLTIDGSVGGSHASGLVPEPHNPVNGGYTTAIPSDVFTVGATMYMHLMRGVIYQTDHSDFWRSTDNGETWEYLCLWPGDQYNGQFQQKTYAVADDGYCYVLSTVFNRGVVSDLLLHRVPQNSLGTPGAYEPWGYANGNWAWGNYPTTITTSRKWGEICFRAMGGKYGFTWLNMEPLGIHAQVFALPTSNLFTTPEQPIILPTTPGNETGNLVASPYGGFIIPGSSFDNFHICVSQWYDSTDYRVMHYRIDGLQS